MVTSQYPERKTLKAASSQHVFGLWGVIDTPHEQHDFESNLVKDFDLA